MEDFDERTTELRGSKEEVEAGFDTLLETVAMELRKIAEQFPRRQYMRKLHPRHSRSIEWDDWPHPVAIIFMLEEMGIDTPNRWHLIVAYEGTSTPISPEIAQRIAAAFFPSGETTEAHVRHQPALHYLQNVTLGEPVAQA